MDTIDDHCTQCGRVEKYPRAANTTYVCSRCTQKLVLSTKSHAEKKIVQPRRSQRLSKPKERETLSSVTLKKDKKSA